MLFQSNEAYSVGRPQSHQVFIEGDDGEPNVVSTNENQMQLNGTFATLQQANSNASLFEDVRMQQNDEREDIPARDSAYMDMSRMEQEPAYEVCT